MLLKDCPVGSFVRLVSAYGNTDYSKVSLSHWVGVFEVMVDKHGSHYVVDKDGDKRDDVFEDKNYQFEIVTPSPKSKGRRKFKIGDRVVCIKDETDAEIGREYTVTSDDDGWDFPAFRFLDDDGTESTYMDDDSFVLAENQAPCVSDQITLNGKTYKLKPHTEPRMTVIDGVTYEMEEI